MAALTTDSDNGPESRGETDRDKRPPRQASPCVLHAPDSPDIAPPFPPRIARPQETRRTDPPCHSSAIQPILGAPTPHGNHFSDGNSHPPLTPQSLEMITAATIAVLNQHLASIGLLPRTVTTLSGDPITDTDAIPPAPRDVPPTPPRTLPVLSHLAPPPPAPVLHSASPTNREIHHLHDDRSPTSSSSQAQHRFHRDFVSKMQAEYRTLDTRRVPRVQPLQFSVHTDRTAATQLLVYSMRDALPGIFDVADPLGSVTMRSLTWVSVWHAPLP